MDKWHLDIQATDSCIVSRYLDEDSWQAGYATMDASVEKRFKTGFTLFAKASNLLNSPMIQYIKKNEKNTICTPMSKDINGGSYRKKGILWIKYFNRNPSVNFNKP